MKCHYDYVWVLAVSFKLLGAANTNDLKPYFFNFADGTVRSPLQEDRRLLDATFLLYRKVLTHVRL